MTSPRPDEPDVRLSIFLHGMRFDFVACLTAALLFLQEHQTRRYTDAVTVAITDTSGLRRLPNERLYLEP
ncbi:hypothetical protein ABZ894_16780 [Nocardia beijingensis]|uniref:hypothetical protein n=1 Tax=Nocardia beijingensis TaxID=95162 RepID=UPI0033DFD552